MTLRDYLELAFLIVGCFLAGVCTEYIRIKTAAVP
jgi:hypothetical protein